MRSHYDFSNAVRGKYIGMAKERKKGLEEGKIFPLTPEDCKVVEGKLRSEGKRWNSLDHLDHWDPRNWANEHNKGGPRRDRLGRFTP